MKKSINLFNFEKREKKLTIWNGTYKFLKTLSTSFWAGVYYHISDKHFLGYSVLTEAPLHFK